MLHVLHKEIGKTPLETIREAFPDEPATYAGRLDPMASGKLLVLTGDDTKKRDQYLHLDKEYVIEVLMDATTDTGDILGMPALSKQITKIESKALLPFLEKETGTHTHPYPAFSSKPVNGKPLFVYALEGTLDTIEIPTHKETIYDIHLCNTKKVPAQELHTCIQKKLARIPRSDDPRKVLGSDFRQDAIREAWDNLLTNTDRTFVIYTLRVTCSSGTYMRSLAQRIGKHVNTNATALSIHRTKIGTYRKVFSFGFWSKQH